MKRTAMIYGALLALSLLAAYWSWTHETDESASRGVVLSDLSPSDWEEIRYEEEGYSASLSREEDAIGEYIWVQTKREGKGELPAREEAFKAGTSADQALERLTPFRASRRIEADESLLEEFGLSPASATLTLSGRGRTHIFEVGKEGYGHRDFYVRDKKTSQVYLVDGGAIRPLTRAEDRLPERRLVDAEAWDIESLVVEFEGQTLGFEHRNREDRTASSWVRTGTQEKDMSAQAWIDKFLRMRSIRTVASEPEGLTTVLEIRVKTAKQETLVTIQKVGEGETEKWYARSEFTRGVVEIPMALASDLNQDLKTLDGPKE